MPTEPEKPRFFIQLPVCLHPKEGSVIFEGQDITKIPGHKIVSMGMAHVPEGRRVFAAAFSVYENLKMGAYTRKDKDEIEADFRRLYMSVSRGWKSVRISWPEP